MHLSGDGHVLCGLMREARQDGLSLDACARLEILLAEVMNNIVEHGMAGRDPGVIDLTVSVHGPEAEITIRDDGHALPQRCLATWDMPAGTDPGSAAEGGYGWPLIRALAHDLAQSRAGGWNRLTMRLYMAGDGGLQDARHGKGARGTVG